MSDKVYINDEDWMAASVKLQQHTAMLKKERISCPPPKLLISGKKGEFGTKGGTFRKCFQIKEGFFNIP